MVGLVVILVDVYGDGELFDNLMSLKWLYFVLCVKYVIFLFMNGGFFYVDIFDLKFEFV